MAIETCSLRNLSRGLPLLGAAMLAQEIFGFFVLVVGLMGGVAGALFLSGLVNLGLAHGVPALFPFSEATRAAVTQAGLSFFDMTSVAGGAAASTLVCLITLLIAGVTCAEVLAQACALGAKFEEK